MFFWPILRHHILVHSDNVEMVSYISHQSERLSLHFISSSGSIYSLIKSICKMLNWTACLFLLAITLSKQSARCIHWQWAHHVCTGVQVTLGWPCGWIATDSTKEIMQSITSYAPYAPYYLGVIRSSDQLVICQRGKTRGASLVLPQYLLWHATLWGASFSLRHY